MGGNFHETDNPNLICYSKTSPERSNAIIIVVDLDWAHAQSGWVTLDFLRSSWSLEGLSPPRMCWAEEDICGKRRDYIELVPGSLPGHILRVRRWLTTERDFDYSF